MKPNFFRKLFRGAVAALIPALVAVAVTVIPAGPAFATETKIGVVDLGRALNDSDAGKEATASLEAMVADKKNKIRSMAESLQAKEQALVKQAFAMKESERVAKQEEYRKERRNYENYLEDAQAEIRRKEGELTSKVLKDIVALVKQYGADKGYTVIFGAGQEQFSANIVYNAKETDITEEVVKLFNANRKKKPE